MNSAAGAWTFTEPGIPLLKARGDETLVGALSLATGPVLCRVQIGLKVELSWRADAGHILLAFARRCARDVVERWPATVDAADYLSTGDPSREIAARLDARQSFETFRWPAAAAAAQATYWAADPRSPAHVRAHQAAHWARRAAGAWARGDQPPNRRADADRRAREEALDRQEAWLRAQIPNLKPTAEKP